MCGINTGRHYTGQAKALSDPIDVFKEAVQLKPKASNMLDFVNYSEHQLLTPG